MTGIQPAAPAPRREIAADALWRPDWTTGEARDPALLWLDKNENADPELNALVARIVGATGTEPCFTYPETAPLYRKLAAWLDVEPENLLLAAGSDGIIRSAFEAYISPGDTVIHTQPTFAMYSVYAAIYGARAVTLDYRPSNEGPVLHADEIIATIGAERPRLVCLPNPDSPTGTAFNEADMRAIVEAAGAAGAVMLVDEAYHPFLALTVLPWVTDYGHLVVARSTGKAWGMAGLRIGYCAAAPKLAAVLQKVRPMYETSTVAVAAFQRMLDHTAEIAASVERLEAGKQAFLAAMRMLGLRTLDGHGNFLHVAFGPHAAMVHAALSDQVVYRHGFAEPCLAGFSRFTATTEERFAPVIARIRDVVERD